MARRSLSLLAFAWRYVWASPTTLLGLAAGVLTLATGGHVHRSRGVLEFHGGFAGWYLRRLARASALTLGHVVLGRDPACLDHCRTHELVHVRQAERWGLFFLPAYALSSLWCFLTGKHFYRDNAFEVEARRLAGED